MSIIFCIFAAFLMNTAMRKPFLLLALASVLLLSCQKQQPAPEPEKDSSAFVNLTDIIPDTYFDFPIRQL
jgi:hypothetical protein